MEIVEYCFGEEKFLTQIERCEWRAAKYLAHLLKEDKLQTALGGGGKLYLLTEGDTLVSFITLSERDCISVSECAKTPWLGFFHTAPEYRGKRLGKMLIDHACDCAHEKGYHRIYIATDHIGLYEKYGFTYLKNATDIYGEDSRVYYKDI